MNEQLPQGWISEVDPQSGRTYYVDTRQQNPAATWEHPSQIGGDGQRGLMSNVMSSFGGKTQQQQTNYNPPSQQCTSISPFAVGLCAASVQSLTACCTSTDASPYPPAGTSYNNQSYQSQTQGYAAPQQNYGSPAASPYPQQQYQQPQQQYQQPQQQYQQQQQQPAKSSGLSSTLMAGAGGLAAGGVATALLGKVLKGGHHGSSHHGGGGGGRMLSSLMGGGGGGGGHHGTFLRARRSQTAR